MGRSWLGLQPAFYCYMSSRVGFETNPTFFGIEEELVWTGKLAGCMKRLVHKISRLLAQLTEGFFVWHILNQSKRFP